MKRNIVRTTLAIVSVATLYLQSQGASAQCSNIGPLSCGATINVACWTLNKNVDCSTPPPGWNRVGITLSNSAGNTPALNLNGHRVIGPSAPVMGSVGVQLEAFDTISGGPAISAFFGPGTIARFETGIVLDFDHNTVSHVHLIHNNNGIRSVFAPNTIIANTLKGNSCLGIGSGPTNNPQFGDDITNNFITGSNAPTGSSACPGGGVGIDVSIAAASVQGNVVNHSTTGMHADLGSVTGITVSGNDFSCNSLHGASISNAQGITVSSNSFNSNGQDGLLLNNVINGSLIQSNLTDGNRVNGIALTNSDDTGLTADQFTGNVALGNSVFDLFEIASPNNTWSINTCDTGSSQNSEFTCP